MSRATQPSRLAVALLAAGLLALLLAVPGATAQWTDAGAWIDQPLNGSKLPVGAPLTVTAHATDAGGVASVELYVNGTRADAAASSGDRVVEADFSWTPPGAGGYLLVVAGVSTAGQRTTSPSAFVFVGTPGEGPGGSASPSPTPSATPSASPSVSPSPTPSPTPKPTPTPIPTPDRTGPQSTIEIQPASPTTDDVVTFTATASDPSGVALITIHWLFVPSGGTGFFLWHTYDCVRVDTCVHSAGPFAVGKLSYYATAQDSAGNTAQTTTLSVTLVH